MPPVKAGKTELLNCVKRIAGQVQAIERALDGDVEGSKTLHLVAATRGAINGSLGVIMDDHAREYVAKIGLPDHQRAQGVQELLESSNRYAY